jgi:hypothetical protein
MSKQGPKPHLINNTDTQAFVECMSCKSIDQWIYFEFPVVKSDVLIAPLEVIKFCDNPDIIKYVYNINCDISILITNASQMGRVRILNWLYNKSILKSANHTFTNYTFDAMDLASNGGHIAVLDWWLNKYITDKLQLKYTSKAVDFASENGHIEILNWWLNAYRNHGIKFKCGTSFVHAIMMRRQYPEIINWWRHSGLPLPFYEESDTEIQRWNKKQSFLLFQEYLEEREQEEREQEEREQEEREQEEREQEEREQEERE